MATKYVVNIASETIDHPDHDPELLPGEEGYVPPRTAAVYGPMGKREMQEFVKLHSPHTSIQVMVLQDPAAAPHRG